MIRRIATHRPSLRRALGRIPQTRRGRLIAITLISAALAVKLTVGVGVALLLLRHLLP